MSTNYHDFTRNLIIAFRANGGTVTEGPFAGRQVLLLTTKGAKSGTVRTTPVVFSVDGDHWVVVGSKSGADSHPAWYLNLLANPNATIEVKGETVSVIATPSSGQERRRLYDQHAELHPGFKDYEKKTSREIPAVVLARTDQAGPKPVG